MRWLKRKLRNWINEPDYNDGREGNAVKLRSSLESDHIEIDPVINFRIYSAQNGKILEFSKYDRVKDRSDRTVYIIGKDEDIAEKVAKCLSLELLR
jgi:hypothetical protein